MGPAIVITAAHALTPLGADDTFIDALMAGRCALRPEPALAAHGHIARLLREGEGATKLLRACEAWAESAREPGLAGITVHSTTKGPAAGGLPGGPAVAPFAIGARTISNACVSSAQALIDGAELLQDGRCDQCIVIGYDAITPFVAQGFRSLEADSALPARPFDRRRDGLSLGEAACAVVLRRDSDVPPARVLARLAGWGASNDANHISGPSRDGAGLALAIERALVGLDKSRVRAVCAHGTATRYNDAMEARAFHAAFGGHPPPVFGIKGAVGHTLGAAGLLEVIVSAHALRRGLVPPTVGFTEGETEFALDVVHGAPREIQPGLLLSTNSGFGGMNTAIVLETP